MRIIPKVQKMLHVEMPVTRTNRKGKPMRCKHEWKVVDKTVFPSILEQLNAGNFRRIAGYMSMGRKKAITIIACTKCGKVKKFKEASWT